MSGAVRHRRDGHVAWITLSRPEARNAVNGDVARGLEDAIDAVEADDDVRVAVLGADTGGQANPVFCAGADLKLVRSGGAREMTTERGGFAGFVFRERTKPVIAAVDGLATAGGCEIVLACDLVVATTRSSFGLAEVKRNLLAAAGGLWRLPRAIGRTTAMEMVLTGEPLSADRAHQLGLVNRLCAPGSLEETARELAASIAANAPLAVRASREVVLAAGGGDEDDLQQMTESLARRVTASADTAEGLAAFVEKRAPRWTGR